MGLKREYVVDGEPGTKTPQLHDYGEDGMEFRIYVSPAELGYRPHNFRLLVTNRAHAMAERAQEIYAAHRLAEAAEPIAGRTKQ